MINDVPAFDEIRVTRVLPATVDGIADAAVILRAGGLVAFPTETVYGLGAHALDPRAVARIFAAKQRPSDDPLIVHLAAASWLDRVARPTALGQRLAGRFWPGPLTLVLPRLEQVPLEVTAGLDTVAVRVPSHAVAHDLLAATGLPVAAPSANLFGRPSPTRAQHVLADLDGRIDAVLDGGQTVVGVESTIVDVSGPRPRLLRPGGVTQEVLEEALGMKLLPAPPRSSGPQRAPGLLPSHYAPRTPLVLITLPPAEGRLQLQAEVESALSAGLRVGVLLLEEDHDLLPAEAARATVGAYDQPHRSASRLFDALRALDALGLDILIARDLADPARGLGQALADRLRRAAQRTVDQP
jgi:L-threonylcarbamoyladenylate synthase